LTSAVFQDGPLNVDYHLTHTTFIFKHDTYI